jgi:hypothetical protein
MHLQVYRGEEEERNTCSCARLVGRGEAMGVGAQRARK